MMGSLSVMKSHTEWRLQYRRTTDTVLNGGCFRCSLFLTSAFASSPFAFCFLFVVGKEGD